MTAETADAERVSLETGREAVAEVLPTMTKLLRSLPDSAAQVVGSWTAADVAAHLTHVVELDLAAARGIGVEKALEAAAVAPPRSPGRLKDMTAALLERDPLRDPALHASRLEGGIHALLGACDGGDELVPWLLGIMLRRSAICSHQVYEMLCHGWDIAQGSGLEWTIPDHLACVAIEGFFVPAIAGLGASDLHQFEPLASCEIQLRGGGRFVLALTEGGPAAYASLEEVDLHMSSDPAAMLLGVSGRGGSAEARIAAGRIDTWGPHPERGLSVFDTIVTP